MINKQAWATPILIGSIDNDEIVNETLNVIFQNYNLNALISETQGPSIFDDENFNDFRCKIVEPAFDQWLIQNRNRTLESFEKRSMKAWVTGAYQGYSMLTHNHSGSQLSAVFYLMNDRTEDNGEIVLFDPRFNANRSYNSEDWKDMFDPIRLQAVPNTFVVFPSFVYHQVTTFTGKIRVAIPVDLYI